MPRDEVDTRDAGVAEVMALERRLLQPGVRASAEALDALLDPEFREIGASGRLWTREAIVRALADEHAADEHAADEHVAEPIRGEDMEGRRLAGHLVLLTYVSESSGRRARRTSLWRLDEAFGWRLLHHQGTPIPSGG